MTGERWERVVGQDRAVALLQRAAERPVPPVHRVGARRAGPDAGLMPPRTGCAGSGWRSGSCTPSAATR